jgi:hypothetical protein
VGSPLGAVRLGTFTVVVVVLALSLEVFSSDFAASGVLEDRALLLYRNERACLCFDSIADDLLMLFASMMDG